MSDAGVLVRIVLAEPDRAPELGTAAALSRLGPGVSVQVVHGAERCLEVASSQEIELIVLDLRLEQANQILGSLPPGTPPIVAVAPGPDEGRALEAFRRGAADCVVATSDLAEVLPAAALDQVRRWRNLREKKRLEKNLYEIRRYNENIIQNMNGALVVVDGAGCVTFANPVAEQILGTEPGALLGSLAWDWFPGQTREQLPLWRTLHQGVRFRGVEAVLTLAGAKRIPVGLSCAPMTDGAGGGSGAVLMFQDLSEIKQLQRQVLQAEKMASIGQLAAGVAHEINNPMGFIHANLSQMSEYVGELAQLWEEVGELRKALEGVNDSGVQRAARRLQQLAEAHDAGFLLADLAKAVRESLEGSERIRHIVQDLRVFSHQSSERVWADLNQCLDSTANIVWTMMKHSVTLEKDYADLPRVCCYPMELKQVFMNLLVNAYQAIEIGLRERGCAGERGVIQLRTRGGSETVVVEVGDTGVGIPPEHVDRIFDPFFTTKPVGEGTGLGLSTSYNIVKRHGGTIRVHSQPRRGTRFEIVLPVRGEETS